jgi:hypothetical protein
MTYEEIVLKNYSAGHIQCSCGPDWARGPDSAHPCSRARVARIFGLQLKCENENPVFTNPELKDKKDD